MPGRIFRQQQWWKQQHRSNVVVAKRASTADENRKALFHSRRFKYAKSFLPRRNNKIHLSIYLFILRRVCLHSKVAHIESVQTIIFRETVAENVEVNYAKFAGGENCLRNFRLLKHRQQTC